MDGEPWQRAIAHVDMDAFFASVEVRDDPRLRGRPLAVGGDGPRGVVATASYEARRYGVHSAMPMSRARALCPDLIVMPGRHAHYRNVSAQIMAVLDRFTPLREAVSVDEAYLDISGVQRLLGHPATIARDIRQAVWDEVHLTCSVGVGISKSVAKIASSRAKPHGIDVVEPERTAEFLAPLPLSAIGGVGPVAQKKFTNLGVVTVGDLAALPPSVVHRAVGSAAPALLALARGEDPRPVGASAKDKSIGKERTFSTDIADPVRLRSIATSMADEVSYQLRRRGLAAKSVSIKVRRPDWSSLTRTGSFPIPVQESEEFRERALVVCERALEGVGAVRLLGVRAEHLVPASSVHAQGDLEGRSATWSDVDRAMDRARERFGVRSLARASGLDKRDLEAKDGTDAGTGETRGGGSR